MTTHVLVTASNELGTRKLAQEPNQIQVCDLKADNVPYKKTAKIFSSLRVLHASERLRIQILARAHWTSQIPRCIAYYVFWTQELFLE